MPFKRLVKKVVSKQSKTTYQPYNFVEISKLALLHNLEVIQSNNPKQSVIPVLKANAYGHGIREVAQILNATQLDLVAVDGYFEANAIRDITKHKILVMGAIKPENVRLLDTKKCSFVVQDTALLSALGKTKRRVRIHMELNTGMQRLGLAENEIDGYLDTLANYPNLQLEGVMSHLADADNIDTAFTARQQQLFDSQVRHIQARGFKPSFVHLAQTAGSTKITSQYCNALRLGIGLYGINPLPKSDPQYRKLDNLKPVMQLKSTVVKVQNLNKGDRVSYNGIFTARKAMRIGVLPLGYYEGFPRELSNIGIVTYKSKSLPVVGRVCMDHTMIDLTDTGAKVGSEIVLISSDSNAINSVQQICQRNNLFSYTLVTGVNEHIRRVIV